MSVPEEMTWKIGQGLVISVLLAACQLRTDATPTPVPFPVSGVRQLTFDAAYYRDLAWSPRGDTIAARKCLVVNGVSQCNSSDEQLILIEVASGEQKPISVDVGAETSVGGYPIEWSPDGSQLLAALGVVTTSEETGIPFQAYRYGSLEVATNSFTELPEGAYPIAYSADGTEILVQLVPIGGEQSLSWLQRPDLPGRTVAFAPPPEGFRGPVYLSPDDGTLLETDNHLPSACSEIRITSILANQDFVSFRSLACFPAWSFDGAKLAFASKNQPRSVPNQLLIADADGRNPTPLFPDAALRDLGFPAWSPDGTEIAFTQGPDGGNAIYIGEVPAQLRP